MMRSQVQTETHGFVPPPLLPCLCYLSEALEDSPKAPVSEARLPDTAHTLSKGYGTWRKGAGGQRPGRERPVTQTRPELWSAPLPLQ